MAGFDSIKKDLQQRMEKTLDKLRQDLSGLRTGRATPALLEPVRVDAYGSMMPLSQLSSISVPEARMLSVQMWDKSLAPNAEKAIRDAGLGLNPSSEGVVIRVPIPQLTEERRHDLAKAASRYAEGARVAVRGIRRDGMDTIKSMEKKSEISKDDEKNWGDQIQKLTNIYTEKADKIVEDKNKEIKQV